MEIKVNVVNEMRKLRNTAYSDRTSWVEELIQNAQRAEAKNVMVLLDYDRVIFEDDGIGCTDPAVLFEKSASGWGQSVSSQNPFGEGFFSTMMVSDMITVESVGFRAVFDVKKILEEGNIDCVKVTSNKSRKKGMKVILTNMREEYSVLGTMRKMNEVCKYITNTRFTLKTFDKDPVMMKKVNVLDGEGKNFTHFIDVDGIKGWMAPFIWGCSNDGYDGDHVKVLAQERFVKNFPLNGVCGVIHTEDGTIDLRSPDRKDIIMNDKYTSFKNKINNMRRQVMLDIVVNGSDEDIDNYEQVVSGVLDVTEYEKYMKFILSTDEAAKGLVKKIDEDKNSMEEIAVSNVNFVPDVAGDVHVSSSPSIVISNVDGAALSRTGNSELYGLLFYVEKDEFNEMYDKIKLAEYYGAKVVLARNRLEVNTLEYRNVPHVDYLNEVVENDLEVLNMNIETPEEKRALFLFNIISQLCGFKSNIFHIGDIIVYRKTSLQDKEVKKEVIETLGVARGGEIYINRDKLKGIMMKEGVEWNDTKLYDNDRKFIVENMEVVAHELAHVIYGTVDNTQEHAESQIVITNKILGGLY